MRRRTRIGCSGSSGTLMTRRSSRPRYRAPSYDRRPPRDAVLRFWQAVKQKIAPIGPLPIEAADSASLRLVPSVEEL